jgi:predicted transposase/invertase (TIGR01784 family)
VPLGIYPTVDYVFKVLFGDPANADLLIHLLNAVLRHKVPIVNVIILNPMLGKEFDEDKDSFLDILAEDETGRKFNVEMQTTIPYDLGERLVFYASKLLAGQLEEAQPYSLLRPVYSICFLTGSMYPHAPAPHLRFLMTDAEQGVVLTEALQVHLIELMKYNSAEENISRGTALEKWAYFLKNAARHEAHELCQLLPGREYRKATGVIEMIAQSSEQRILHEARLRAQRDRASAAEYAERCREIGREEGVDLGIDIGLKQGLIGQIRVLEKVLHKSPTENAVLVSHDVAKLQAIIAELEAALDQQGSN